MDLGGFLLDAARADFDEDRVSIVLGALAEEIEDVIFHVVHPWWREQSCTQDPRAALRCRPAPYPGSSCAAYPL